MGCNGGQQSAALSWMTEAGVVTGGDYFDKADKAGGCKPYEFAPCAHHVPPSAKYPACPSGEYSIRCSRSCSDSSYAKSYSSDKVRGSRASAVGSVSGMVAALEKGPLSVAFDV